MSGSKISANQYFDRNYTEVRKELSDKFQKSGGNEPARFGTKDGATGIYVKKKVSTGRFNPFKFINAKIRKMRYEAVALGVMKTVDKQFGQMTFKPGEGKPQISIAEFVREGMSGRTEVDRDFMRKVDSLLAEGLRDFAKQKLGVVDRAVSNHLAKALESSDPRLITNMAQNGEKIFLGAKMIREAIAKDLAASPSEAPKFQVAGDEFEGTLASMEAEKFFDKAAGKAMNKGLHPDPLLRAIAAMKERGCQTDHLEALKDTLNLQTKAALARPQLRTLNQAMIDNAAPIHKGEAFNIASENYNLVKTLDAAMATPWSASHTDDVVEIFDKLEANYQKTLKFANSIPDTPFYADLKTATLAQADATHDLLVAILPQQGGRNLRDDLVAQNRQIASGDTSVDGQQALQDFDADKLSTSVSVPKNVFTRYRDEMNTTAAMADPGNYRPSGSALRDKYALTFLTQDVTFANNTMAEMKNALEAYQDAPTYENLSRLNEAVNQASLANDYLTRSLDRTSSRHKLREFGHQRLMPGRATKKIRLQSEIVAEQRQAIQRLGRLVGHAAAQHINGPVQQPQPEAVQKPAEAPKAPDLGGVILQVPQKPAAKPEGHSPADLMHRKGHVEARTMQDRAMLQSAAKNLEHALRDYSHKAGKLLNDLGSLANGDPVSAFDLGKGLAELASAVPVSRSTVNTLVEFILRLDAPGKPADDGKEVDDGQEGDPITVNVDDAVELVNMMEANEGGPPKNVFDAEGKNQLFADDLANRKEAADQIEAALYEDMDRDQELAKSKAQDEAKT